jgi:bifunctional non-homologous end joining protein LigD
VLPGQFVARSGAGHRQGRIYIDYLRNGVGASTVCAWSVRARAGLGVSVPVEWSEIETLSGGAHWTVANVAGRLERGNAPWQGGSQKPPSLARAMKKLGFEAAAAG